MALGSAWNSFTHAVNSNAGFLNPKNYNKNMMTVAKEAHTPTLQAVKNKGQNMMNSAMEATLDFVSLSDEAKSELQQKDRKGWKAKTF